MKLQILNRMKALPKETEKLGIESEKTGETLGETSENVGVETPVVVEKAAMKKKVRIVKKIVKKKVIKKVPKRVSVGPDCNDLEKVSTTIPNDNDPMETENPNPVVDVVKEVKNVKEFEVSDMEKRIHLVENIDCCRDESQINGLITSSPLGDQNQIELQNSDQNGIEMQDSDHKRIELQGSDQNRTESLDNDHSHIELRDNDQNEIELQDSDQNQIELQDKEHDIKTMNVEEHEGEEGVKELVVNSEVDGLKSQEDLSERRVMSGETVASGLHMKQRTKIFIHGLVEGTKEEDIRKVFEEVGDVVEVKVITNFRSGKSRGFGFIRYALADHANLALTKYQSVEVCGRQCHTAAIEGNDTIVLNNIDKTWSNENVFEMLQKIGIKKVDEVSVVPDPDNTGLNRGFAFLEFVTKRDAQMAYDTLQNKNVLGVHSNINVSWADPSVDLIEEERNTVKSVYAEHIPSSWDEKEVKDHFKIYGEIESIALAKNLRSTKRNDFAFINYKTSEAALSCIEALTYKKSTSNNGPKALLKVSLAKSMPKFKPFKTISESAVNEVSKVNQKANQSRQSQSQYQQGSQSRQSQEHLSFLGMYKPPQKPKNMIISSIGRHEDSRKDGGSSTTAELVQLLREQASWKQGGPSSTTGMGTGHYQPPSRGKQLFTEQNTHMQGSKSSYYHDPRAYPQTHLQIPNATHPRPTANTTFFPRYNQQYPHHTSGSVNVVEPNPRYNIQATYPGNSSSIYRQMH